jgi:hypothetical protein
VTTADEYRQRAKECEAVARIVPRQRIKDEYLDLAEQYRLLAYLAESASPRRRIQGH